MFFEKPFLCKISGEVVMKKLHFLGISFLLFVLIAPNAYATAREWVLDQAHSNIYFSVGHIYSKIHGHFNEFTSKVNFDPENLKESRFFFKIKVDSIDTGISKRDKHLL
jgi:polyisoprenoid-binding protein YceI